MSYSYIWYIDFAENYVFTKEGRCFNLLTGKQIKQCLHGYTVGYNIKGKFYSLKTLRTHLIKIKKTNCPF
jgi:hypothetical protein